MTQIPDSNDWRNEHGDLDVAWAKKHFFGLNHEQAVALFRENALSYQEDIMFMPFPCFKFYIHAYLEYLLSEASRDDADGASCFFGIVKCRRTDVNRLLEPTKIQIDQVLDKLAAEQDFYGAEVEIYGSFALRAPTRQG